MKEFNISFKGLANKVHRFEYQIGRSFFEQYENSDLEDCEIEVALEFDKKETFFHLKFFIDGTINVPCDRCLEHFNKEIFGDYELFVKFGDANVEEESEDDVMYISRNDDHINVAKPIYDYILLSIPLRCVHPDMNTGESGCNQEILKRMKNKNEESVDPRWEALQKLKSKKQ